MLGLVSLACRLRGLDQVVQQIRVQAFLERLTGAEATSMGSSLKFCLVAEGAADFYPRVVPTMEWDTGAADAVAREAGKRVLNWETKEPLLYNKEDLLNPWFIVE